MLCICSVKPPPQQKFNYSELKPTISKCETHNESKKKKLGSQLLIPLPTVARILLKWKGKRNDKTAGTGRRNDQTAGTGKERNYLTPASPTMPIAMPAERPASPQDKPDER